MDHATLKERQRAERDGHGENLALRVHRALSWLGRAEREANDLDASFIFHWIAFNAAYATDIDDRYRQPEREAFRDFLRKLDALDGERALEQLTWTEFPNAIRLLLNNRFVFQPFWEHQAGRKSAEQWQDEFQRANRAAHKALGARDTSVVLSIALSRLYTLRNQLVHGGATWNSGVNRDQLRDGCALLGKLVPLVIKLMMDHPDTLWGDAAYPVVKD